MIAAIIQARMGSTRLPGKVMMDLAGKPVLAHVIERTKAIEGIDLIIGAFPDLPESRCLVELAEDMHINPFLGPVKDKIERYLAAAQCYDVDIIMRITADCPLLQPDLCTKVLELYKEGECSYAAIDWPRTFPKGYGCEVFSKFTLQLANDLALELYDREHVTPWMQRNVRCKYLTQDKDESHLNYCIDTIEDLARIRALMQKVGSGAIDRNLQSTIKCQ